MTVGILSCEVRLKLFMTKFEQLRAAVQDGSNEYDGFWREHLAAAHKLRQEMVKFLECPDSALVVLTLDKEHDLKNILMTPTKMMYLTDDSEGFWFMPMKLQFGFKNVTFHLGVRKNQNGLFDLRIDETSKTLDINDPQAIEEFITDFYNKLLSDYKNAIERFQKDHSLSHLQYVRSR